MHFVDLDCKSVSATCPVDNTIYGYYPSLPLNIFFVVFFGIIAIEQVFLGIYYRSYFYAYVLTVGSLSEAIGYAGRILLNSNPYSGPGFRLQITCLIFAPSFIAAAIYITLTHLVLTFGTSKSRITPKYYTWIFISCDTVALVLQAVGGGLAGGAGKNKGMRDRGTNVMFAGIVWQVATLVVFAALVVDYTVQTKRAWNDVPESAKVLGKRLSFKLFAGGVVVAFLTIFLRCVYRIAEIEGGWANPIMRDETSFVIMEGFMIVIAAFVLTKFYPGRCFPQMVGSQRSKGITSSVDEEVAEKA